MTPSQLLMDPRSMSLDDIRFPPVTRAGFWNPSALLNQHGHDLEKTSNLSWRFAEQSLVTNSNKTYNNMEGQAENSLFSSSLSDLFTKNLRLSTHNAHCRQPAHVDEEGPFESLKEIEAQTIGNLLPDDKDLLSGVNYDLEPHIASDIEDADIFSRGGGMELVEDQDGLSRGRPIAGEHPSAQRPSRTLFVTNISSNLEDAELKDLFEKYGDIQTLNTTCKQRGFVTVSYYDIRAACDAMRSLQDKPLRRRNLDIHFSIPKDNPVETDIYEGALVVHNLDFPVSNYDLHQIFGVYGEIKEIRENPYCHHKFIEFYDVRAAQAALRALKRSDISEKQIRVEPSRTRQWCFLQWSGIVSPTYTLVQLSSPELEQGQSIAYFQQGSPPDSTIGAIGPVFNGAISSGCMENGTAQSMHSSLENRLAIRQLVENGLHQSLPPSGPHRSPSMSLAHLGNTCRLGEPSLNLENIEFSFQGRPLFDPHTLPEYRDGLACGVPYSSPGIRPTSISSRAREVTTNEHIHSVGLNGNALEPNDSVLGSGNGSCPLHGQQYMWNNTNLYQHHPSNPLMWPNMPSYMNGMHVHPWQDVHAHCPSTASHMLNSILPRQHHMGSSPTLDPFLWQRRHVYEGDSHETSEFHPGSLGNTALSGDSSLHQLELNSFPHHLVDLPIASANVGLHSSGKRYHMLPRRHSMINMANSFDGSNERVVSRRSEVTSSLADSKKPYDLNIDLISRGEDSRTTLMIKNIPNKYTSKMLLAAIDEHHRGTYNFIYLPIDFKNKCNVGYAFINMINPSQIVPFYQAFNGKKWEKFNSEKVASLAYARIQGKAALIAHFQNSSLMNEDKRCRPILFHSDGPNAGDQEPFPLGVNIRSRPGKHRTSSNEENHQESTLNRDNGENAFNIMDSSSSSVRDSE